MLYLGTNFKMYKTIAQTEDYLRSLQRLTQDVDPARTQLFVIPSYTALQAASACLGENTGILLGAQNMCWEEEGQFTGEISPAMLKETGVSLVELGHSERRHVLGETNEQIRAKVDCALRNDLRTLLCIGETLAQRDCNTADEVLAIQLKTALSEVGEQARIWIAYEPVWAIGVNGIAASAEYVARRHKHIRKILIELFGGHGADIPILYGGSVNRENARELLRMPNTDGLFIGRSAWDADSFSTIIHACSAGTSDR